MDKPYVDAAQGYMDLSAQVGALVADYPPKDPVAQVVNDWASNIVMLSNSLAVTLIIEAYSQAKIVVPKVDFEYSFKFDLTTVEVVRHQFHIAWDGLCDVLGYPEDDTKDGPVVSLTTVHGKARIAYSYFEMLSAVPLLIESGFDSESMNTFVGAKASASPPSATTSNGSYL